jgi:hypothetical protein
LRGSYNGLGPSPGLAVTKPQVSRVVTTVPDRNAKVAKLKAVFKGVLMFGLVLAVVCLVLFFWCTARYTSSSHTDRFTKLTAIDGASTYYDWNRDRTTRNGFQSIKTVAWNKQCFDKNVAKVDSNWNELNLFRWPGSKAGYLNKNKDKAGKQIGYVAGTLAKPPAANTGPNQIAATTPETKDLTDYYARPNVWKNVKFCYKDYMTSDTKETVPKGDAAKGFFVLARIDAATKKCATLPNYKDEHQSAVQCSKCDCVHFVKDLSGNTKTLNFKTAAGDAKLVGPGSQFDQTTASAVNYAGVANFWTHTTKGGFSYLSLKKQEARTTGGALSANQKLFNKGIMSFCPIGAFRYSVDMTTNEATAYANVVKGLSGGTYATPAHTTKKFA